MPLVVNGTEMDTVVVNGVTMDSVFFNGVEVYTRFELIDNVPNVSDAQPDFGFIPSAAVVFKSDAAIDKDASVGTTPDVGYWGLPLISGIGSDYQVRATYGSLTGGVGSVVGNMSSGVWYTISSDRSVGVRNSSSSDSTSTLSVTYDIRPVSGSIELSGSFVCTASVQE